MDGIAFQSLYMLYKYLKTHKFDKIENCLIIKLSTGYTAHILKNTHVEFENCWMKTVGDAFQS